MNATEQLKQMLHHVVVTISTPEFQFQLPPNARVTVEDMISDRTFLDKIKHCIVEESLKDTDVGPDKLHALFDEVLATYAPEKWLRLFGYFFCGVYVKESLEMLIQMSDAFACAFYHFYKEDPNEEFVFDIMKFTYSPNVINLGLFVDREFLSREVEGLNLTLQTVQATIVENTNTNPNGAHWMVSVVTTEDTIRSADYVAYMIFLMGRKSFFNRPDKTGLFLNMAQQMWDLHCDTLVMYNKKDTAPAGNNSSVH